MLLTCFTDNYFTVTNAHFPVVFHLKNTNVIHIKTTEGRKCNQYGF
nr:MAG TPA: hypothetical protein [Caudoviricetes sp.]